MATEWIYNNNRYTSQSDLEAAVVELKSRLDNNPTDWVTVKEVTSDGNGGWVIPSETLSDSEINSLDASSYYTVHSMYSGLSHIGISGDEATAKVAEYRTEYAQIIGANTILEEYSPTNVDMSGYV